MKIIGYIIGYTIMICALIPTTFFFLFNFAYVISSDPSITKESPIKISLVTLIIMALLITGINQLTKHIRQSNKTSKIENKNV